MVLPGHLAGGYLATDALLIATHPSFSPEQIITLLIIGTLFGEGPDIDVVLFYLKQRFGKAHTIQSHREYPTHAPILWLLASLIIVLIGYIAHSLFTSYVGWVILCGSWSHFILDSIEFGIAWLWPVLNRRFYLRDIVEPDISTHTKGTPAYYWQFVSKHYFKRVTFYAEIVVTICALWVLCT